MNDKIIIKGAKENNLKNISLELPKNKLIVMTGLSGSGKTTLAFDTIYGEGQRRYVESLSPYARTFLGGINKPDVESIEGLSPAISIDQKTTSHNPRSTVGTVTEIYDYLRLLYARIGVPYCPTHHIPIVGQTITEMVKTIYTYPLGSKIQVLAPVVIRKKGTQKDLLEKCLKNGFSRVQIDGEMIRVEDALDLEIDKNKNHNVDIIVDRMALNEENRTRLVEALEVALKEANGVADVKIADEIVHFSENYACKECGFTIPKLEPRLFSFNAPIGACKDCKGLSVKLEMDVDLLIPNKNLSIKQGAIAFYKYNENGENLDWQELDNLCKHYNIDIDKPYKDLTEKEKHYVLYGSDEPIRYETHSRGGTIRKKYGYIEGAKVHIERLYSETESELMRNWYENFIIEKECQTCHGDRLNEKALAVLIGNKNIAELTKMPISDILKFFDELELSPQQQEISRLLIAEIKNRLQFLVNVGLSYLTLHRTASTLSGGEAQRIRLATQIGSKLTGVLYVLDEPSIGLHQRDNQKLIDTLKQMRDLGNTMIVVEHDEETIRSADHIVDIGPLAGINGGKIVGQGTVEDIMNSKESITGKYLSGEYKIEVPNKRRKGNGKTLKIVGASENNLKNINVEIPLNTFCVVTGVSGSGKSTLVNEILYKTLYSTIYKKKLKPGKCKQILGIENIDKVVNVSQDPIGRTPRSNPATYTGVFDPIRDAFASTIEAKERGYTKSRFTFNVKGGRCERCQGDGVIRVPMQFLPDVYVPCEECHGKRYNEETLAVTYKGKNIYEVLDMDVETAYEFFSNVPAIRNKLKVLMDVGLNYIKLGQNALTLSGGEAQRIKLAYELQKKATGKTLFILDEPTTGLHIHDVKKLISVLNRIVDNKDSILLIEHNMDIIKVADYIIDLGPEGGNEGGRVVVTGTPEKVAKCEKSYTGKFLKDYLK